MSYNYASYQTSPSTSLYDRRNIPNKPVTLTINRTLPNSSRSNSPLPLSPASALRYPVPVSSSTNSPRVNAFERPTSPPHASKSSGPSDKDAEHFTNLCRSFYYDASASAEESITAALTDAPANYRRAYAEIQTKVRQEFHRDQEKDRRRQLAASLQACESGSLLRKSCGIASGSLDGLRGSQARDERRRQLKNFLNSFAVPSIIGTHPFIRSLYAVLLLQSLSQAEGGAEHELIEWNIDDAVFLEAGGPEFLREAVKLLKGYFGFEDTVKEVHLSRQTSLASSIGTSETVEISKKQPVLPPRRPPNTPLSSRERSGSDPFTDLKANSSDSKLSVQSNADSDSTSPMPTPSLTAPLLAPITSRQTIRPSSAQSYHLSTRSFTVPAYLTDPELRSLCKLFPSFIRSPSPARFTTRNRNVEDGETEITILKGHGSLQLSSKPRDMGYKGKVMERFIAWLANLCG